MWDVSPRKVLVVASADCDAALLYAADEARRRRCGVHLVHVAPLVYGDPAPVGSVTVITDEQHRIGTNLLKEAAAKLDRELRDDNLAVSIELCRGSATAALIAESIHACLVVIQHPCMGPDRETRTLSSTDGIAARANAPVVLVPADWRPEPPIRTPVVTVGVGDVKTSAEIVRMALEHADRADARLRLVHAYKTQAAARRHLTGAADSRRLRTQLTDAFASLLTAHPEVPLEVTLSRDEPAEALLRLSTDSSLLVIGHRRPGLPLTAHLGPVARAVLHRSPVPVLVVDPNPEDRPGADSAAMATAAIP